jgi:lysophospholipase L1-like esterase
MTVRRLRGARERRSIWAIPVALGITFGALSAARAQNLSSLPPIAQKKLSLPATVPTEKPAWVRSKHGTPFPAHSHPGKAATPTPPGVYVAIGDSITFGTGITDTCSTYPDHPVDIEEFCADHFGKSYPERVAYALRDAGIAGRFMNLGIGGATVGQVLKEELPWLPPDATVITLYIGTNDLRLVESHKLALDTTMQLYEKGYKMILDYLHQKVPNAKVVLVNVPNQKMLNGTGQYQPDQLAMLDKTSQLGDTFIDAMYPKYAVVDTICQPYTYDLALQFNGGVHPNDAGAAPLADLIVKGMEAKTPPAPAKTCTWFNNPAGTPPAEPAPASTRKGKPEAAAPPKPDAD